MPGTARRAGLVLFGLLSLGDVATIFLTNGRTPPYWIAAVSAVLGVVSLVLVVRAWRRPDRPIRALLVLRILSAISTLPALTGRNIPAAALASAVAIIVLTVAAILLSVRGRHAVVTA